jgi:hypothetical protein
MKSNKSTKAGKPTASREDIARAIEKCFNDLRSGKLPVAEAERRAKRLGRALENLQQKRSD